MEARADCHGAGGRLMDFGAVLLPDSIVVPGFDISSRNLVERILRRVLAPRPKETPWQYGERVCMFDNESPRRGQRWSSDSAFFIREFMECFADNHIRDLAARCSAQSAKTQTIEVLLAWLIENDPGPAMWLMANADDVKSFARRRLIPFLESCTAIAHLLPDDRRKRKVDELILATMSLLLRGAQSKGKLSSNPVRYLFMDEVRDWPAWAKLTVEKRTRAYWNAKRVMISTADQANDVVDQSFLRGDQRRFQCVCPHCAFPQELQFGDERTPFGLKWEKDSTTFSAGEWDFDALAKTIRYECINCHDTFQDTPRIRRQIVTNGHWKKTNLKADPTRASFTWSALLPEWVPWWESVKELLDAKAALDRGDREPLKTFVNETKGESWLDALGDVKNWGFLEDRKADYLRASGLPEGEVWKWDEEVSRLFWIDVQGKGGRHFKWVCRAYSKTGASRLVDYGTSWTIAEVRSKIEELNVNPDDVGIDSGNWSSEVYQYVIESGYRWKAMKGDKCAYFKVDGVRMIWQWSEVDPYIGTPQQGKAMPIPLLIFSSSGAKDKLASYMNAIPGFASWDIAEDTEEVYFSEMTAEERQEVVVRGGVGVQYLWVQKRKDNHTFDCEQGCLIMAMAKGIIYTAPPVKADQPELFHGEQEEHKGPYVGPDGKTHYVLRA